MIINRGIDAIIDLGFIPDDAVERREVRVEHSISFSFNLAEYKKLRKGDSITYGGKKFYLKSDYIPTVNRETGDFKYSLKFYDVTERFKDFKLKYVQGETKELDFVITTTGSNLAQIVIDAISDSGLGTFTIGTTPSGVKEIQFTDLSIWDALELIADTYQIEWWISGSVLNFGKLESGSPRVLKYDREIDDIRFTPSSAELVTRLYAFGSTRNIPADYRASTGTIGYVSDKRLRLPNSTGYVDLFSNLPSSQIVEGVKVFEEVFPRQINAIISVEENVIVTSSTPVEGEENPVATQTTTIYTIVGNNSFDITQADIVAGQPLKIGFRSGALSGREFDLIIKGENRFEIRYKQENNSYIPNPSLKPQVGDTFFFFNFKVDAVMPTLIADAEQELLSEAESYLDKLGSEFVYDITMRSIYCEDNLVDLSIGDVVTIESEAIGLVTSRIRAYEKKLQNKYEATYQVGDYSKYSRLDALGKKKEEKRKTSEVDYSAIYSTLEEWSSDGKISPSEKLAIKQTRQRIVVEREAVIAGASKYSIPVESYETAWVAYDLVLAKYSADEPEHIPIEEDFALAEEEYKAQKIAIDNAIINAQKEDINSRQPVGSYLTVSAFNEVFTINRDTGGNIVSIAVNHPFFGEHEISAYGIGDGSSGGGGGVNLLQSWADYNATTMGSSWAVSAQLVKGIKDDIANLPIADHTHTIENVTGLSGALGDKLDVSVFNNHASNGTPNVKHLSDEQLEKLNNLANWWKVDVSGRLYTDKDVYSTGEISAYGLGAGGSVGGGVDLLQSWADYDSATMGSSWAVSAQLVKGIKDDVANLALADHTHSWTQITGKPTTFAPSTHSHTKSQITDFPSTWGWGSLTGIPTAIAGTQESFTTTLKTKLDSLANYTHPSSHPISFIDGLQTALDGKASSTHTHSGVYEPVLGNPSVSGYLLSSTTAGVRSWVKPYALPTASATTLGGVKIGERLSISNGVLSANVQSDNNFTTTLKNKLDGIEENANNYTLPTASASVLGGVKIGTNVSITSGVISVHNPLTIGTANGLSLSTQQLSLALANTTSNGALSASDKTYIDLLRSFFEYDSTNDAVKVLKALYSTDEVSSYGLGSGSSTGGGDVLQDWANYNLTTEGWAISSKLVKDIKDDVANLALADHTHSWTQITGKPTTFTPSTHTHTKSQITDFPSTWAWGSLSGVPSTFTPSTHSHSWDSITSKPTTFTPSTHSHSIADVSGLQTALDGKSDTGHTHAYVPLTRTVNNKALSANISLTYSDVGAPSAVGYNKANWDTAYGWGDYKQYGLGLGVVTNSAINSPLFGTANTGFYRYASTAGDTPDTSHGFLINVYRTSSLNARIALSDSGKLYFTSGSSDVTWKELYHTGNLTSLSQLTDNIGVATHIANTSNPHSVTKTQVGLGNVDNTADSAKNVLSATKLTTARTINGTSFNGSVNITTANWGTSRTLTIGNTGKAVNGSADVAWSLTEIGAASSTSFSSHTGNTSNPHSVTKAQVGLGNVDNTSDASKPVSTATQTALNLKLNKSIFDDLFEKVEVSTGVYAIKAKYSFYSTGEVSSYGLGSGGATGGGDVLQDWASYNVSTEGWAISAKLVKGIKDDVSNLALANHTHTKSQITDFPTTWAWGSLTGVPSTFTPSSHSHSWSEITSKPSTFAPSAHTLGSHSDVTITSIAAGEILKWDGTKWVNNTLAEAGISTGYSSISWSDVTDKPTTFTPSTHSHSWSTITSKPSTFAPSAHTLDSHSNVTITSNSSGEILKWNGTAWVNNTLAEAGISASSHSHSWSEITSKPTTFTPSTHTHDWLNITGKPTTYTPSLHSHEISDVTGLQTALNAKFNSSNIVVATTLPTTPNPNTFYFIEE